MSDFLTCFSKKPFRYLSPPPTQQKWDMLWTKHNRFHEPHAFLVLFWQKLFTSINIWWVYPLPSEQHRGGLDMTPTAPPARLDAVRKAGGRHTKYWLMWIIFVKIKLEMHEVHETYCVLFIAYPIFAGQGVAKVSKRFFEKKF